MKKGDITERMQRRLITAIQAADKQQRDADIILMMVDKMINNGVYLSFIGKDLLLIATRRHLEDTH